MDNFRLDKLRSMVEDPDLMREDYFNSLFSLYGAKGFDQENPHHNLDLMEHLIAVAKEVPEEHYIVRIAAIFHDVGKLETKVLDNGHARFHGHDVVGAAMVRRDLEGVLAPDLLDDVCLLIKNHMRPLGYVNQPFGNKGVRRLVRKSQGHFVNIDDLMLLNRADILAHDVNAIGRTLPGHLKLAEHIERVRVGA